jgi:kinesin family member 11
MHSSYTTLGRDLRSTFDEIMSQMEGQRAEINTLRSQLQGAARQAVEESQLSSAQVKQLAEEERRVLDVERQQLFSQIKSLIEEADQKRADRWQRGLAGIETGVTSSAAALDLVRSSYSEKMDVWDEKEKEFVGHVDVARNTVAQRIDVDRDVSIRVPRHQDIQS